VPLLAATWVAPLVKRFGARKVVTVGLVTMATASLVTGVLALERQYLLMIPCLVLVGLGIALTGVPVQALTVAELPESKRGLSGAGLALVRELGGAFGVAFLVTVATVMERLRVDAIVRGLSSVEASDLESLLAGRPSAQASLGALLDAGCQLVQTDASQTIAVATRVALVVGGLLSLFGTLVVWRLLAGLQPDLDSLGDLEPAVE
jgi:MFS family permease